MDVFNTYPTFGGVSIEVQLPSFSLPRAKQRRYRFFVPSPVATYQRQRARLLTTYWS